MKNLLVYSPGGGGGHFVRNYSLVCELLKRSSEIKIYWIINIHFINRVEEMLELDTHRLELFKLKNSAARKKNLRRIIASLSTKVDSIYVDTFYFGIENELEELLCEKNFRKRYYCFRRMKPSTETYVLNDIRENPGTTYTDVFIPNDPKIRGYDNFEGIDFIHSTGQILLKSNSSTSNDMPSNDVITKNLVISIIHLGPDEEINRLKVIAQSTIALLDNHKVKLRMFTRSQNKFQFPNIQNIREADIIISGAGYNICNEIAYYGKFGIIVPFDRSHDDQKSRVKDFIRNFPNRIFTEENYNSKLLELGNTILNPTEPNNPNSINFNGAGNIATYILNGELNG